jgi:preprotein translocase subunit SecG
MISVILITLRFLVNTVYNINYIYSAETYPTVLRANGLSFNSIFGRCGIIINMLLVEILEKKYFIFCFVMCLICLVLSFFLKETYKLEIKDFIEEKHEGDEDD